MAATMPVPTPVPAPSRAVLPSPHSAAASGAGRRANPGDRLTVDPDDRRRRARTALLELAVARSVERRRAL
ncbi:hypothetical protein ACFQ8T_00290 [Isoptericola sp. NPDC056618]|uniref:hypothetical protein n=1 Tax=Isoptericola sp. NPDC056618 TaxID=3345878 RepID=UPI0036CEECB6